MADGKGVVLTAAWGPWLAACTCMGGPEMCVPPFGASGGCSLSDDEPRICAGCGDIDPRHWREGGWYCESCAACEVCQSPYCDEPEHHG
jgi:hypothetical protein